MADSKQLVIEDFTKYQVYEGENWEVYIHKNQYFLGRVYLWHKSDFDQESQDYSELRNFDLLEMQGEVRDEFFDLGKRVKNALDELFQPDLYNIAQLGNVSAHLHIHMIPRYETEREFDEITFKDERWGKNYAPYNKDFRVPEKTLLKLRSALADKLTGR